jgi:hypothetical protein
MAASGGLATLQVGTHIGFGDVADVRNPGILDSPRLFDDGPSLKPSEIRDIASNDHAWTKQGDSPPSSSSNKYSANVATS